MKRVLAIAVLGLVPVLFIGCPARTSVGNGAGIKSPDGRFSLAIRISGAYGRAYVDKSTKQVSIWILSGTNWETTLFSHSYSLVGSDVDWGIDWSTPEQVSVQLYDWGDGISNYDNMKHMSVSNNLMSFSFARNAATGKFDEKK